MKLLSADGWDHPADSARLRRGERDVGQHFAVSAQIGRVLPAVSAGPDSAAAECGDARGDIGGSLNRLSR